MSARAYALRLDPWSADYDASIQLPSEVDAEAPLPRVETDVEGAWRALRPPAGAPPRLCLIDGVRRIEHRLLVEQGERVHFGLLGSLAVGAVEVADEARIATARVARVICVGGGLEVEALVAPVAGSRFELAFAPEIVAENTPAAPLQGLQNAMRRREAELAVECAATGESLVLLDGPLGFLTVYDAPVVGYVKRLLRPYLEAEAFALVPALEVGERTPLFLLPELERYSWYLRIGRGRVIDAALAGIVRLEVPSALALDTAVGLADATAAALPRLASDHTRDPRAPQNLLPVGALETELRRRLGDVLLVRRAVEARLHAEATA
jgi:hypothetical protein